MDNDRLALLIKRTIEQDEEAFEELFKEYYPSVYKAAMKLCHNDADAQDVAQLTFLQVRKSIHTLEKPQYFPLWINRICVNKCKNLFRDNKSELYDDEYMKYFNLATEERREYVSEALAHFTSDQEVLMKLIATLSKEHQDILYYLYFYECNQEEVAKLLDIPIGTVKSRAYAARNALKAKVKEYEEKEQIKLDFHMEGLSSLFLLYFLQQQISWSKGILLIHKPSLIERISSFLSGASANYIIAACVVVIGSGLLGIYHEYTYSHHPSVEEEKQFPTVQVDTYTITNEKDAYYLLRGYAYDEKALQVVSDALIQEMEPLYEALKKSNGSFYQLLKQSGWTSSYEKRLKKF